MMTVKKTDGTEGVQAKVDTKVQGYFAALKILRQKKKELTAEENKIYNVMKSDHNIPKIVSRYEFALQCLDPEVRVARELNHEDLKERIGYQMDLSLVPAKTAQKDKKDPVKAARGKLEVVSRG